MDIRTLAFRQLFSLVFLGSRDGYLRYKIVKLLKHASMNGNTISSRTGYDYTVVRKNLHILVGNGMLNVVNQPKLGSIYFLSHAMEDNIELFDSLKVKYAKTT